MSSWFRLPLLFAIIFCFAVSSTAAARPNVIIILADDMGYGDPQCYNAESKIPTPHLDQLAARGVRFTDAHTPSSVCTPTRYTLLTGRYCWRTRLKSSVLDGFSPSLIDRNRATIASTLKARGYATACIGKWHLGMDWTRQNGSHEPEDRAPRGFRPGDDIDFSQPITGGPLAVGFDSFFGISASLDMPPYCWIENDRCVPAPDTTVLTARDTIFLNQTGGAAHSDFRLEDVLPTLKQRTVTWIKDQHARDADQPFFLYLPLNSPHLPVAPSKAFAGTSQAGHYGDFVVETDDVVGAVVKTLERTGDLANTLIIFTSDNGGLWHQWTPQEADDLAHYRPTPRGKYTAGFGHHSNAHLRGTKADIWEGGHRVPFIVQWPAKVAGGQVSDRPMELTDVFATVLEALDLEHPEGTAPDSFSFHSELSGKPSAEPQRPFLVHHSLRGMFAVREGDWKFVEARGSGGFSTPRLIQPRDGHPTGQLYNLANDPQETMNLYLQGPAKVKAMQALLNRAKSSEGLRE